MKMLRNLSRYLLCVAPLLAASGCAYLIPEDPSAPRYNLVAGERKRPQYNEEALARATATAPEMMASPGFPPAPVAPMPVSPAPMVAPPVPAPVHAPVAASAYGHLPSPVSGRSVPSENLMLASPPSFDSVPPRPHSEATRSDLEATRTALEASHHQAMAAQSALQAEIAAEPSITFPAPPPPIAPAVTAMPAPSILDSGVPLPPPPVDSATLPPLPAAPVTAEGFVPPLPEPAGVPIAQADGSFDPMAVGVPPAGFPQGAQGGMASSPARTLLPPSRYGARRR